MRVLRKEDIEQERLKIIRELRNCLFIHPTDTIYGIGCNATTSKLVRKLRKVKKQFTRPISVIAPNIDWIYENCEVNKEAEEWLDRLPGPYTLILKLKNKEAISRNVTLGGETIGVRIPSHCIRKFVEDMGVPVVTTSANLTGKDFMTNVEELDPMIEKEVKYALYEGPLEGKPSKLVDLTGKEPKILRN